MIVAIRLLIYGVGTGYRISGDGMSRHPYSKVGWRFIIVLQRFRKLRPLVLIDSLLVTAFAIACSSSPEPPAPAQPFIKDFAVIFEVLASLAGVKGYSS